MEYFLLIIVLVLLLLVLSKIDTKFKALNNSIENLERKINLLRKQITPEDVVVPKATETIIKTVEIKETAAQETKGAAETKNIADQTVDNPIVKPIEEALVTPVNKPIEKPVEQEKTMIPLADKTAEKIVFTGQNTRSINQVLPPKKSWYATFKEKNPDIEKFIGENLINKLGILILVLGISYFVKFSIDKGWISEPARVGIGVLCGGLVMFIAQKLKRNFAAFSSVMVAGAISILYYTFAIAFHDYHLFSQTVTFILMVFVTAFSCLVSVSYSRQELAVLSLIGGFTVPFMISTGEGNYKVLFTYIAILDIGILAIAYFKKWNLVTILSFVFTIFLFSGWYISSFETDNFSNLGAFVFATVFYILFSITSVINNLRNKGTFTTIEYFMISLNTFYYFGIGLIILKNWELHYQGLFTIILSLYNLLYAMFLYKKFGLDKNAIYLLLGFTLTFVTLTIPIQFRGHYITMFWAAESVLLFWMSQKSKINTFKLGAIIVQILMLFSLLIDWVKRYSISIIELNVVLNPIFITGGVVLASLIATHFLLRKENQNSKVVFINFNPAFYRKLALTISIIVGYIVGMLEVSYQANRFIESYFSALSFTTVYHFIFSAIFIYVIQKQGKPLFDKWLVVLASFNIFLYIVVFYKLPVKELINNYTQNLHSNYAFYLHYILLICLGYFMKVIIAKCISKSVFSIFNSKVVLWLFAFSIVYILSNECIIHGTHFTSNIVSTQELAMKFPKVNHHSDYNYYDKQYYVVDKVDHIKTQIIKIVYPILWGVLAFVFLIIGIKQQWKQLRIIALSLIGITILKLFIYDINNVSETGKIIAFILLGVLILIISFVYQKIKKLVVDNPIENNIQDNNNDEIHII